MKSTLILVFLIFQGASAAPLPCTEVNKPSVQESLVPLYQEFESLLAEWEEVPPGDRVKERRLSPKIKKLALKILKSIGVVATESWDYKRVLVIKPVKGVSDWNDFAYRMHSDYGVKVIYDPMKLKAEKAGALYVDESRSLYISNEVVLKLYKTQNLQVWNTSNENHEATHAIVSFLQRQKIWHPLWAELKTDSDQLQLHETYDSYLAFDEIITHHEQIMEETSMARLLEGTTEEVVNFMFPILQDITRIAHSNILHFKDFKSKGYETDWKLSKKENRYTITSDKTNLELVLPYRKQMKKSEAEDLAQIQIEKILAITTKLLETYKRAEHARLQKNWNELNALLKATHDLVALPKTPVTRDTQLR